VVRANAAKGRERVDTIRELIPTLDESPVEFHQMQAGL